MSYRQRVTRDLDRWIADGLVDAGKREAILARLPARRPAWSASGAAAILGAVLLALAALSFVAANWADLSRVARFAVILGALWAAFGASAFAFARRNEAIGHALALLGAALFGIAIMLTAQTFNMSAFRNTGVLIWTLGALATAVVLPSRPVLILASLLGAGWVWLESVNPFAPDIIWSYLGVWAVTGLAAARLQSRASWNLISPGLLVWFGFVLFDLGEGAGLSELEQVVLFALLAGALALAASVARGRAVFGTGVLTNWAATAALLAGWAVQFPIRSFERSQDLAQRQDWVDTEGRWAALFGLEGGAFLLPAAIAAGLIMAVALWRRARGSLPSSAAIAIALAAAALLGLPYAVRWAGPDLVLALRLGAGTLVFAVAVGLILQGAREGRRFIGGLGIAVFIVQTLYVYESLFGDLLGTALFFFIGGVVLIAVSLGITKLGNRLSARQARSQGGTS